MAAQFHSSLALIVKSQPYEHRVARANIDLALAAAALDFEIQVYFAGSSILQIVAERNTGDAMLPPGYRAWAALPDLAETSFYAEQGWLDFCAGNGVKLLLPVEALSSSRMKQAWRNCRHVMVL
jgi:sulfur relay (sulfurtransferase) DsrF/TusC family protein